ncbi:MAG TPA: oligosaccharide flippase family protein [Ferruginibacter sp.]|nr:oligosaccharide flippase family protein [Ferruginibacter sp.]HMP19435.1 oligosaccharide flippase family protein [Ferruginibacter sp.]
MATLTGILKFGAGREAKTVAIYTFANFFNKGISFLLLFYFATVLTEADFGLLSLFSNSILLLMPFVSLGILQSVNAEYFRQDKKEFSNLFSSTLLLPVVVAAAAILLLLAFKQPLQQRYAFPSVMIGIIPVITLFTFLNEHLINMVRNNNDPVKYLVVNIGRLATEIVLAVFFISALEMGWLGRVLGMFVSLLLVAVYAIIYFRERQYLSGSIRKKYIRSELVYSIPIIVMQAAVFCMGSSAAYFIDYFTHDLSAVGIFSIAATFASVILVLCTALLQYVYPKVYSILAQNNINYSALRRLMIWYAGVMLTGTAAVIAAAPVAYSIMLKPAYNTGLSYYWLVCIGYFFWSLSYLLYAFMLYRKQKRKILLASVISIILSLASHYFFVKQAGSFGAAFSIAIVYAAVFCITLIFVRKELSPIFQPQKKGLL